jgi:hypothetical protein
LDSDQNYGCADAVARVGILNWLESAKVTQGEFASMLRGHSELANFVADLLEPRGCNGWKLILKRSRRGAPNQEVPGLIEHFYAMEVEERGERNAIKRLAKELKMSPAAIRSKVRRGAGAHGKRRKRGGRK